jgi:hypothetical protein
MLGIVAHACKVLLVTTVSLVHDGTTDTCTLYRSSCVLQCCYKQIFTASTTAATTTQQAVALSDTVDWQLRLQQFDDADISVLTANTTSTATDSASTSSSVTKQHRAGNNKASAAAKTPAVLLAPWIVSQLIAGIPSVEDCGTVEDELQLIEEEADVSPTWSATSSSLAQRLYSPELNRVPVAGKAPKEEGRLKVYYYMYYIL